MTDRNIRKETGRKYGVSLPQLRPSPKNKKQRRLIVHVRPAIYHEVVKNTTEVGREMRQSGRRRVGRCVAKKKKRHLTSMTVPKNKKSRNRAQITPLGIHLHYGLN